ncbi:alpha/beta fold hydrolase [Marinobacter bohaiensis]|uniref:alpha/beta fold hydrolase n=1 Tax=Marinobacter bohaiensis TaxID=2201898 RepID=UPI000DABD45D|nr:alpha/beta hydrolase [Marinobacter bohaiensis]
MNKPATVVPAREGQAANTPKETAWPLRHLTLAGLTWHGNVALPDSGIPILGLHGWLDNAATFTRVAPALGDIGPFYGIDLPGHGHSQHRSPGEHYSLLDYAADVVELIDHHFERPVAIVGHSLGGIIGTLVAASFPEKVDKLVMIDSLGPLSQAAGDSPGQLRKAIRKRLRGAGAAATYRTLEDAAKVRAGGLSPLSDEAAHLLVPRNLEEVDGGFRWRTDARLRFPSPGRLDEAQVHAFLQAIEAPTLLLRAESGLLGGREKWQQRSQLIRNLQDVTVPGSHHCHLDGDVAPVTDAIRAFLKS